MYSSYNTTYISGNTNARTIDPNRIGRAAHKAAIPNFVEVAIAITKVTLATPLAIIHKTLKNFAINNFIYTPTLQRRS